MKLVMKVKLNIDYNKYGFVYDDDFKEYIIWKKSVKALVIKNNILKIIKPNIATYKIFADMVKDDVVYFEEEPQTITLNIEDDGENKVLRLTAKEFETIMKMKLQIQEEKQ